MRAHLRIMAGLLTPAQRRRWLAMAPMLVVAGIVESAATGLVFVLIKLAGDPGYALREQPLATVFQALPWRSEGAIVLGYGVFLALFFVLRAVLLLVVGHVMFRAEADTMAALSSRLLDSYLRAPFALHLRHSASELAHDVTAGVDRVVTGGMGAAVNIASEIFVAAGLCAFLVAAAPVVTVVTTTVLAVLVIAALVITKKSSGRWGRTRDELSRRTSKELHQSLGGVREIKVLGREQAFHDAFALAHLTMARTHRRHATMIAAPRLAIETIFVCCVVLVVALVMLRGDRTTDVVPILGIYAYAGFRLIPAANRLLLRVDSLRIVGPTIERVNAHLRLFEGARATTPPSPEPPLAFNDAIVLENVSYTYEGAPTPVLFDVSLTIRRGESIGVVGPSGAGKSTLIDLILGLLEPTSGRILVDGVDIAGARRGWQRRIGYVPQASFLFDDTIERNVALGVPPAEVDPRRLADALRLAQLGELMTSLPEGTRTIVGDRGIRMSGGQRQRLAIARALYHEPELIVFDEATAALDNQTERELTRAIEELRGEKTLIVIAHRLTTVERCDALVFLRDGRVEAVGPYARLVEESPEFRAMASP